MTNEKRDNRDKVNLIRCGRNPYKGFDNVCSLALNWKEVERLDKMGSKRIDYYYAFIDESDVAKVLDHAEFWYFDKSKNLVRATNSSIYLHRLIMDINDPNLTVHHLNADPKMNCKRNLLIVTRDQHNHFHTILERIQDKGNFDDLRLILEISENVINRMQETTHAEYELRLLEYERSLEETLTN